MRGYEVGFGAMLLASTSLGSAWAQLPPGASSVTDGTTTVYSPNKLDFTTGCTVTNGGNGLANLACGNASPSTVTATNGLNARTLANWMGDTVNVLGQSVVGDGVTNDQAALLTASGLAQSKGEVLFLPAQNNSGAAAVYDLSSDWKPAAGDLSVFIAPGATFTGAGLPKFDNQFPHYAYPIYSSISNVRTFGTFYNPYANVDLDMDIAVNTGTANVVAIQGVGVSTTTTSPTWGANFVCVQEAASGSSCNGTEIDTIANISGAQVYGLVVTAQGSFASNSAISISATASGVQWTNGLVFQQTVTGGLAPATNALIETTAFSGSTGYGMRMRGSYSVDEMNWPSLLVGPTPATLDGRLSITGSNSGSGVTLAVVTNDGGATTADPLTISSLGPSPISLGNGDGTQFQVQDGGTSTVNFGYVKGGATGTAVTFGCGFNGDANTACIMSPRGTAAFTIQNTGGGASAQFTAGASTISRFQFAAAASGSDINLSVGGTATGFDITAGATNEVKFGSHLGFTSTTGTPTAAACEGTGTVAGMDTDFKVTGGGTTSTTCTISFGNTWAATPVCLVGEPGGTAVTGTASWVTTTGSIVITTPTTDTGAIFYVHCLGTT